MSSLVSAISTSLNAEERLEPSIFKGKFKAPANLQPHDGFIDMD
jgi:hypothetical protein